MWMERVLGWERVWSRKIGWDGLRQVLHAHVL